MKIKFFLVITIFVLFTITGGAVFAQDFGFGFDDNAGTSDSAPDCRECRR
jgi:hypothetical protein